MISIFQHELKTWIFNGQYGFVDSTLTPFNKQPSLYKWHWIGPSLPTTVYTKGAFTNYVIQWRGGWCRGTGTEGRLRGLSILPLEIVKERFQNHKIFRLRRAFPTTSLLSLWHTVINQLITHHQTSKFLADYVSITEAGGRRGLHLDYGGGQIPESWIM